MSRYLDPAWQIAMRVRFDFNNLMAENVGDEHGFSTAELERHANLAQAALAAVQAQRRAGGLRWMELPYQEVDALLALAAEIRANFKNFVVLGIGGSALGTIALQDELLHPFHNQLSAEKRGSPALYVLDNIDPDWLSGLLDVLDPTETCFNIVTKSGDTAETMAQLLWARRLLIDRLGATRYAEHIVATTDAVTGSLRPLVNGERFRSCLVPEGVGGRFSVLSPVGLLPAAVTGMDVPALLAGAAYADRLSQTPFLWQNVALMFALTQYLAYRRGKPMSVMMPYAQGLRTVADWYAQLWAESLGKALDRQGQVVNVGPTPIKTLGATDQHSQVQLFVEGPHDKIFTFILPTDSAIRWRFPPGRAVRMPWITWVGTRSTSCWPRRPKAPRWPWPQPAGPMPRSTCRRSTHSLQGSSSICSKWLRPSAVSSTISMPSTSPEWRAARCAHSPSWAGQATRQNAPRSRRREKSGTPATRSDAAR